MSKRNVVFILLILIFSFITTFVLFYCFAVPSIKLNGNTYVKLEYPNKYIDEGYTCSRDNVYVKITDNIDYGKVGTYEIDYIVYNKLKTSNKIFKRNVILSDTIKPVITLNGGNITLKKGYKYVEPGYKANDNYDGDITSRVVVTNNVNILKEGHYSISYTVFDSSGNFFETKRDVEVVANDIESIPILTYHNFMTTAEKNTYAKNDEYVLDVSVFEQHLKYLKDNGYKTITLDEFYDWYNKKISLTGKNIVITIDDGNLSQYVYAVPLLEKYGFNATIFVVTSRINDYKVTWNPKKNQFFSTEIIDDIIKNHSTSIKLESHSDNLHRSINGVAAIRTVSNEEIEADFKKSKEILNSHYLAFPFGFNTTDSNDILKKTGYKMAFAFGMGNYGYATRSDSQYYIKRINASVSLNNLKQTLEG